MPRLCDDHGGESQRGYGGQQPFEIANHDDTPLKSGSALVETRVGYWDATETTVVKKIAVGPDKRTTILKNAEIP
jgi:hypothetical protein